MGSIDGPNHRAFTDEYEAPKKELFRPSEKLRISVTGAAGRMGSAICQHLKKEGHHIIASDWTKNEHMAEDEFCDEYHIVDPTVMDDCLKVTRGVDLIFHFATSAKGLGFIESNPSVTKDDNTIIGYNMVEAARINGVQRFFDASVAYINPELKQAETNVSLNESVACLVERQYPIGFEKPETEVLCKRYHEEFGFECRIGRFYCIYGPFGTWEGGRGKARAAICGEPSISTDKFGMLGDGPHTIMDSYVEDVLRQLLQLSCCKLTLVSSHVLLLLIVWFPLLSVCRLMNSDCREPVYIGSLNMRDLVILGSDDHKKLGCAAVLKNWLRMLRFWIKKGIGKVKPQGTDSSTVGSSEVVGTGAPVERGSLRTADGEE
ncbi:GDP-mannose 3,5-epimerase 1-like [Syzygium oleosum]|uniref:GDP-mannose 3,5-epimerase 1-like n=1 Tax=Syzygium oleosum TaxID=219896 RepID=UPI0024BA99F9|nr:GDP-mannose 3,5-epimerase 1-like [Syzygium oleosum]